MKKTLTLLSLFAFANAFSQNAPGVLTVEKIMRDPKWMGTSPTIVGWGISGDKLYFNWNPDKAPADSLYYIAWPKTEIIKATSTEKNEVVPADFVQHNRDNTAATWEENGNIFYKKNKEAAVQVTKTIARESNPDFAFGDEKIVFSQDRNLYAWDIKKGSVEQLTNFTTEEDSKTPALNEQEQWLQTFQLENFEILKERKEKKDSTEAYNKAHGPKPLKAISIKDKTVSNVSMSQNGNFVAYVLSKPERGKSTIVPTYVTESGFTENLNARTKVGSLPVGEDLFLYDRVLDSVFPISMKELPGIKAIPAYFSDYPNALKKLQKDSAAKTLQFSTPVWQPEGNMAIVNISSIDNKDRWVALLNGDTKKITVVSHQHDDAWIGGPGTYIVGWISNNKPWYQSEQTGYSHLYVYDLNTKSETALTSGKYEVQNAKLSKDKKSFYIVTNEVHPGEKHFYKLDIASGKKIQLTKMEGAHDPDLSPDEKWIADLFSNSTTPWELYVQENKAGATPKQITNKAMSDEYKSFQWRKPELITFKAADGADVYARVYKPENATPGKPAVIFVHGAGYLQNAHKWWSSYFREYMFNNLLADNGYYVMDIDYRASSGYGRDWRTGIYRFMGGKDLTDQIDGVKYMQQNFQIDTSRVGIYGGSYGGFITLMGLFTTPDVFKAGAALRPVTDWSSYNHGYTANILNTPVTDSIAYWKSSPINHAAGLKNHLLICHGMLDVNVHYQDVVRLAQRLIELKKDNWELASYPMEDHGFVEPSSWTDEYKRIFKLFESTLKK